MISKDLVLAARKDVLARLGEYGISDRISVKIKATSGADWIAMYRARTQFTGGGRGPIFWISPTLDESLAECFLEDGAGSPTSKDVMEQLVMSMLHEYGHVIAEWAFYRSERIQRMISSAWPGESHGRPWDEEEFAEDVAKFLMGMFVYESAALGGILSEYAAEAFESTRSYDSDTVT